MSTTFSSTTKDASKDKDSSETYVRDASESSKQTTGKSGKTATFDSSTKDSSDKSHDVDITSSSYGFNKDTGKGFSGQQQQYGGQRGQFSNDQEGGEFRRGGQPQLPQLDVQQKLKEVGNLLQKAGHLLQDLQGSSFSGDFQQQQYSRPSGGNHGGPFGGAESSYRSGPCGHQEHIGSGSCSYGQQYASQHPSQQAQWQSSRPSVEWSQYETQQRGPQQYNRWNEDREERGIFGRGINYSSRPEFQRYERASVDRFGGFGGPNRPDLAYGQQYGQQGQQQWGQSGVQGWRGGRYHGEDSDLEFSALRR